LQSSKLDKLIENLELSSKDVNEFKKLKLNRTQLRDLAMLMKVDKNLIRRCVDIFRYVNTKNSSEILKEYKNDMKAQIYKINRADYEIDYLLKNKKGLYISFHDEEDFEIDEIFNELKASFYQNEQTSIL